MKKNNFLYNLTDYKIKSIGSKLPKTTSKIKNMLLKELEKLRIECVKECKKETNIIHIHSIIDKYKRLSKPLIDYVLMIIETEEPFIILERKENYEKSI